MIRRKDLKAAAAAAEYYMHVPFDHSTHHQPQYCTHPQKYITQNIYFGPPPPHQQLFN